MSNITILQEILEVQCLGEKTKSFIFASIFHTSDEKDMSGDYLYIFDLKPGDLITADGYLIFIIAITIPNSDIYDLTESDHLGVMRQRIDKSNCRQIYSYNVTNELFSSSTFNKTSKVLRAQRLLQVL